MTDRLPALAAACLALAGASLALAHEPVYDAWAWLVWGRELAGLGLDTASGPSWKPLPVALAAPLSLAGGAAPALWLVLARASWLLALVLAGRLAYRLTAERDRRLRAAAATFAAVCLLLLADPFTTWTRQGAGGMSEPLLVALVLAASGAALDGRSRPALALGGLAALVRPEAWPLLGAYGLWRWRAEPPLRPWIAALAIAVPALWLGPDLLASGSPASAGARAQRGTGAPLHEGLEVFARAAAMPLVVAWPLALLAAVSARAARGVATRRSGGRRDDASRRTPDPHGGSGGAVAAPPRGLPALAAGALAWIAIVAGMAAAGFPGLPRFMAPAVAVVGVLAGVGLAHLLALVRRGRPRPLAIALAALLAIAAQLPGRAAELPHAMATTARIARSHDRLRALTRAIGRQRLLRCGKLAMSDVLVRTALAWELDVPISAVVSFGVPPTLSGAFVVGPKASARLRRHMRSHAELLGTRGEWRVYSIGCPPSAAGISDSSRARSAGVSGARR